MDLTKIDEEIKAGLKLKAIDRLKNLINVHPNKLELRDKLAQLYYDAGFYDAAGKYWILNNSNEPHIIKCVELYERSVNNSGSQILKEIQFRGDKDTLTFYALNKLEKLEKDSLEKTNKIPEFKKWNNEPSQETNKGNKSIGCFVAAVIGISVITIFIIGIRTVYVWFVGR